MLSGAEASFRELNHAGTVPHPSIEVNGMTTMRLHRLHLSSNPCPRTLAISWPHSQRVSLSWHKEGIGELVDVIASDYCVGEIENDY
jgi:hypothetical protein